MTIRYAKNFLRRWKRASRRNGWGLNSTLYAICALKADLEARGLI